MLRAVFVFLGVSFFFSSASLAAAQIIRFPTPTPTPRPRPSVSVSPTPTPEPSAVPCPTVTVQAQPAQPIRDGQPASFTLNIAGGDPKVVPMILWSTSAGTVKQGQNTRRIEMDTTGAGGTYDREIKAEVWVGGYAPECLLQASASVKIIAPAVKFGEFGELDSKTVSTNLKALAAYLSQSPDNLYLIAYAGRKSERGYAFNWIRRMKDELTAAGIEPRRIIAMEGGFREEPLFDFWIVPLGAEPPRHAPTVNRKEIVFPPKTAPPKKQP
ncbi:MAG: hypothetical protein ABR530_06080 [Pyrinomonadaceae bacterium]